MRQLPQFVFILFCTGLANTATALEPMPLPKGLLQLSAYPAPLTHLQDLDAEPYRLEEQQGSWVFVHFWASWCGPCRKEMPAIQNMAEMLQAEGLKLAVINTAEDEDTVFSFLSAHAPNLHPLMDRDGQVTEKWQPRGLPATYLVDPQGRVRFQALGGREWDTPAYLTFLRRLMQNK